MPHEEESKLARYKQIGSPHSGPQFVEQNMESGAQLPSRNQKIAALTVLILLVAGYAIYSQKIALSGILSLLDRFTVLNFFICFSLAFFQVLFQASRLWAMLLAGEVTLTWLQVFRSFSLGQLINDFLPARAGDVAKVGLLKRTARDNAASLARIAGGVFIADKLADVCGLLFWSALGGRGLLRESFREVDFSALAYLAGSVGLIAFVLLGLLFLKTGSRIAKRVLGVLKEIIPFLQSRYLVLGLIFAGLAWCVEIVNVRALSAAVGQEISFFESLTVIILLNIGIAVPVSIANVGIFEAAMAFGLTRMGVPIEAAVVIATMHHVIQVAAVTFSVVSFWIGQAFCPVQRSNKEGFQVTATDKSRAADYYESTAQHYNESVSKGPLRYLRDRERQAVLGFAAVSDPTSKTLIDVGCGGGFYALAAKKAGLRVCAVDIAPSMIEAIKDKVDHAYVSDLESIRTNETYDIVVCSGVLDFVLDPELALRNLSTLVAPAGRVVIQVPRAGFAGWIYRLEKRVLGIRVNLFSVDWFNEISAKCGLEVLDFTYPLPTNMVVHLVPKALRESHN